MGEAYIIFQACLKSFKSEILNMSDKKKDTKDPKESKQEDKKKDEGLGLLEEDDEFEEFPSDEWSAGEEDPDDINVWEDNWDEDTVEDDFSKQLKAELERVSKAQQDVEMKG